MDEATKRTIIMDALESVIRDCEVYHVNVNKATLVSRLTVETEAKVRHALLLLEEK